MKDFHVAPVEIAEDFDGEIANLESETRDIVHEAPLDRFRRISKQVASQSANIKWNEVLKGATVEAYSQIGRSKNRTSFKNQQNMLKAMEQAKKLIERQPASPSLSDHSNLDVTNQTLVALLKNISDEINELEPKRYPSSPCQRSVTPLHSLNVQIQSILSKTPSPRVGTKNTSHRRAKSPQPLQFVSTQRSALDGLISPPPRNEAARRGSADMKSNNKNIRERPRSPTPDSMISLAAMEIKASSPPEMKPSKSAGGSYNVVKKKAPQSPSAMTSNNDKRPTMQISTFSTTPATPLPSLKSVSSAAIGSTTYPEFKIDLASSAIVASDLMNGSTEQLVPKSKPSARPFSPSRPMSPLRPVSPACLRPPKKVEDVNTIKRQLKGGWL